MSYSIWVNNKEIPVNEDVYKAYWKGVRKERYFAESDMHNHIVSYDALDTEEMNGCDMFQYKSQPPVEEQVIGTLETEQLYSALKRLSAEETYIIWQLYFYDVSLRKLAQKLNLPLSTLHYRHHKILQKLRTYMTASRSIS